MGKLKCFTNESQSFLSIPKKFGGLGFKDIHNFNIALLGKQSWRLLTSPSSLVSRIYKARYYPHSSYLDADIGNNPSYVWRSIIESQALVKGGIVRRIGNGYKTDIWKHPWLPDRLNPYVETEMPIQLAGATVASLMLPDGSGWDEECLSDILSVRDIDLIRQVPCRPQVKDAWCWMDDMRGMYSVKSAYKQLMGDLSFSYGSQPFTAWNKIWKLKTPPKIRNFVWRAVRGVLPTCTELKERRVDLDVRTRNDNPYFIRLH
ncbi:hypothetical protein OROHE_025122 [Orobanche hederae]